MTREVSSARCTLEAVMRYLADQVRHPTMTQADYNKFAQELVKIKSAVSQSLEHLRRIDL